jgi:hypothetical protein
VWLLVRGSGFARSISPRLSVDRLWRLGLATTEGHPWICLSSDAQGDNTQTLQPNQQGQRTQNKAVDPTLSTNKSWAQCVTGVELHRCARRPGVSLWRNRAADVTRRARPTQPLCEWPTFAISTYSRPPLPLTSSSMRCVCTLRRSAGRRLGARASRNLAGRQAGGERWWTMGGVGKGGSKHAASRWGRAGDSVGCR